MKIRKNISINVEGETVFLSLFPPLVFRISRITNEYISAIDQNKENEFWDKLEQNFTIQEIKDFKSRLEYIQNNILDNDENNLQNKFFDLTPNIRTLTFNLTRQCNLRCTYCFENNWNHEDIQNMSFETAKRAINCFFTKPLNETSIVFTGGEPCLDFKLIKEVVDYIETLNLKTNFSIKTNGTLLDDSSIDFLIKHNFKIQISLDGCKEAHNLHRKYPNGKDTFSIIDGIIKKLISRNYGSQLYLAGTLTHQTLPYIEESYATFKSYDGIQNYTLKPVMVDNHDIHQLSSIDRKTYTQSFMNNTNYMDILNRKNQLKHICGIGLWNIAIDIDGNIYPCYRLCGNKKYLMGDVYNYNGISIPPDIAEIYTIQERIDCKDCYFLQICKTGCYVEKIKFKTHDNTCYIPYKQIIRDKFFTEIVHKGLFNKIEVL